MLCRVRLARFRGGSAGDAELARGLRLRLGDGRSKADRRQAGEDPEYPGRPGFSRVDRDNLGLRAIERNAGTLEASANDRLDRLVRVSDPTGVGSRYLAAVADPAYASAFGKLIAHPTDAPVGMTEAEAESVRVVAAVMAERAMAEGSGSAGGSAPRTSSTRASSSRVTAP